MHPIVTPLAPRPSGHYSQAMVANGFVFVSGQLPLMPFPEKVIPEGIEAQCRQVLENVRVILVAAGSSLEQLVSVQVFITKVSHWAAFNTAFQSALGSHKPSRTVIPCGELRHGALVEINAVAVLA